MPNLDLSRVKKNVPVLYAPNPGFVKSRPSLLDSKPADAEVDGPMIMTGKSEYLGDCIDDLRVEVFAKCKGEEKGSAFWLRLSDLIMVH